MSDPISDTGINMEFLLKADEESISMLVNSIKDKLKRSGIEFTCRASLANLGEVEQYFRGLTASKSFGTHATFYCDIKAKPEMLFGTPPILREIGIQIGISPPFYLLIDVYSGKMTRVVTDGNLIESLNLAENLIIKVLEEVGILPLLQSRSFSRWVLWDINTPSQKVRDLRYWTGGLAAAVSNELFPLEKEHLKKENSEKYIFSQEDIVINLTSKCFHYLTRYEKKPDLSWRFIIISEKKPEKETAFFKYFYGFGEILSAGLTISELSKKAEALDKRIGESESNLAGIIKQLSTNQDNSSIFANMESLEPVFWELIRDNSVFADEVKYMTDIVENRDLETDTELILKEISKRDSSDNAFIKELSVVLDKELETLTSQTILLTDRSKHLNDDFLSLKGSLATRIQLKLERQNLTIQNALGMLQVVAVMVFLFEVMKYFYPFIDDNEHISVYLLILIAPIVLAYPLYKRLRKDDHIA